MQSHNRVAQNPSERPAKEVCIVARVLDSAEPEPPNPLDELTGLAETAGTDVVAGILQRRISPDQRTFIGKGKVDELKQLVKLHDADVVVFDNDLSPAQTRNLEKAIDTKVLDRTELILDIFANNARTYESRLAVELAQLEYSLPRLKRMWTHLSRQTMGVGMRGPGEKQLEVDRRLAVKRIHELKEELRKIERRKQREVAARRERMTVSLVGYTNAGKSTLMNALTDANVEAADKLFATLDTRTRRWQLPGWGPVLLSDTVGFIRDLPHHLIASFRATLEEAREADLLLHVADASNPAVLQQISAVYEVLKELGIEEKDTLLLLNKVDVPGAEERCILIQQRYPNALRLSAKSRAGFPELADKVSQALSREFAHVRLKLPLADGKTVAWLIQVGEILHKEYHDDHVAIEVRLPSRHLGKLQAIQPDLEHIPCAAESVVPTLLSADQDDSLPGNHEEVA